jgi:cytochrome b
VKQPARIWRLVMAIWMLLVLVGPTAVFAFEGSGDKSETSNVFYQEEGGEEAAVQESSPESVVGFVLGLVAALIALIIAVVAVLGAVSLGIIGIGYTSVNSAEE